ncbi:MAG: MoaD/ThiS family protein, partial [Anaerolineae bacterium]
MRVQIRFHGILRDKLPAELKGRTAVSLPDDAAIQDLLDFFGITGHIQTAVNDDLIDDWQTPLKTGDQVD